VRTMTKPLGGFLSTLSFSDCQKQVMRTKEDDTEQRPYSTFMFLVWRMWSTSSDPEAMSRRTTRRMVRLFCSQFEVNIC
jgi:hypothetical protein